MKRWVIIVPSLILVLVCVVAVVITIGNGNIKNSKADTATTRTFTFVNNTQQTIWAGALANSGLTTPENGGWEMAPGSTHTFTVANNWGGRFWGRTNCTFNSAGAGTCETGDCGGVLTCKGAGGIPPATLAEFTLDGADGKDFYDVSFVDGYNVPMTITPVGGATPIAGNQYWCGSAGCGTDLNTNCPTALQQKDAGGQIVACKSACEAFNTDQYCCRGNYATAATCKPTEWPVNYAEYFKSNCPAAYSYAYDDPTSTFTDSNADYKITFGPAGGSASAPVASNTPTPVPTSAATVTSSPVTSPPVTTPSSNNMFSLLSGGTLSTTAASTTSTATIASAGGINHDGTPTNATTYEKTGITATYDSSKSTTFSLLLDAGTNIADGTQLEIRYDFTGDGTWDRTEVYKYYATDAASGWEDYTQAQGLKSSSGNFANLVHGNVEVLIWSALGKSTTSMQIGNKSTVAIPY